jgi:lipopolysaccharide export system permease protein
MKTVRRLLYRDIVVGGFVALAFLSLFFFIDFVDELDEHRPQRPHRLASVLAAALYECRATSTSCCRSRC